MTKKKRNSTKVHQIDCLEGLTSKVKPRTANLVIADPPYNIGVNYEAYVDKKKTSEYLDWFRDRAVKIHEALHDHGTFWLFINDSLVSEVDVLCKSLGFFKRSHVIWHYTFGQNSQKNFTPSHTHLLYYTKRKTKFTFNKDDDGLRHPSARQVKYKDKRANPKGRLPDNTWVIFPELMSENFDPAGDTWLASRVCGTYNEREAHSPNQIPLPIMERIVIATSKPGDLVVDPFCGTGSSGVAAKLHGRSYVGFDVSETCVAESQKRIADVRKRTKS